MDRFDDLVILLLLRDETITAARIAALLIIPLSQRRPMIAELMPNHMRRLEGLLEANRWDAEIAISSLRNAIPARRWLEVCSVLAASRGETALVDRQLFAQGGLGSVWKARDPNSARVVALKEMRPELATHDSLVKRFLLEVKTTANLEHPSIVPVYWISPECPSEPPHYVMRFLEGETLGVAIDKLHAVRTANPKKFAADVRTLVGRFLRACEALAYAHSRGVIHRDIKPDNIVLSDFGSVFLIDWGLARILSQEESVTETSLCHEVPPSDVTHVGDRLGTPYWMAPEQAAGHTGILDERTDVYGLGATLFTILTGSAPHAVRKTEDPELLIANIIRRPAPRCRELVRDTSPAVDAICAKAMAMNPSERYRSVLALIDDLQHWLRNEPVSAYIEPVQRRIARWSLNHPRWSMPAIIALVGAIVTCATLPVAGRFRARQLMTARTYTLHRQIDAVAKKLEHDFERLRAAAQAATQINEVSKFLQQPEHPSPALAQTIAAAAPAALGFRSVELIPFIQHASALSIEINATGGAVNSNRFRGFDAKFAQHLDGLSKPRFWISRRDPSDDAIHDNSDYLLHLAVPAYTEGRTALAGVACFAVDFEPCFRELLEITVIAEWFALLDMDGGIMMCGESGMMVQDQIVQRFAPVGEPAMSFPMFRFERKSSSDAFGLEKDPAYPQIVRFLKEVDSIEDEMVIPEPEELIYVRRFRCREHEEPMLGIVIRTRRHDLLFAPFDPLFHFNILTAAAIIASCGMGIALWQLLRRNARYS